MKVFLRLLHALAVAVVCFSTFVGSAIVCVSLAMSRFVPWEVAHAREWLLVPLFVAAVLLAIAIVAVFRQVAWRWIILTAVIPVALFAFLISDNRQVSPPDLGWRAEHDDPGVQTFMWLSKTGPFSRMQEWEAEDTPNPSGETLRLPENAEEWTKYVHSHRDAIAADYERLQLARQWLQRVVEQPPRGTWRYPSGAPVLNFRAIRRISDVWNARAFLLASDGDAEAGIRSLLPLIRAMAVLQSSGPALVHEMMAVVVLKQNLRVAQTILHTFPVATPAKAELRHALETAPSIHHVLRNAFGGEIEFSLSTLGGALEWKGPPRTGHPQIDLALDSGWRFATPLLYNPNASSGRVADSLSAMQLLAEARKLDALAALKPRAAEGYQQLKNPSGRLLEAMIVPEIEKAMHAFWKFEDLRTEVLAELQKPENP